MNKETVYSLITFADYLAIRYKEQYGEDISILKMNKVLYFCFAYWGAYVRMGKNNIDNIEMDGLENYSEYLFDTEFKAGVYGPYMKNLSKINNKYFIQYEKEKELHNFIVKNQYGGNVYKFLEPLIRDAFEANEFDLMDISMKDEEYKRAKDNNYGIMDNDKIIDEYCKTMF
mgnify:CR=1 FL=1